MRAALGFALAVASLTALPGCGDSGSGPAPNDPTKAQTQSSGGSGPLAALESSPLQNEAWRSENGQQQGLLYYPRENLRVSASCRTAAGQLACDAMRFMRAGAPVEIARRALDGRTSAGVKVCMRMNQPIVILRNAAGDEDSFCQFPDGSLVSNGALEQYKMHVAQ